jgi:hypothetical protein
MENEQQKSQFIECRVLTVTPKGAFEKKISKDGQILSSLVNTIYPLPKPLFESYKELCNIISLVRKFISGISGLILICEI